MGTDSSVPIFNIPMKRKEDNRMKNKLFTGIMPALITPIEEDGALRASSAQRIMEYELSEGAKGFYINGNTGEGLFLSEKTRRELAELAVAVNRGRGVVINHVGAVDALSALRLARHSGEIGCNAISSMVPNYVATYTDDQILDYYKRLADASSLPVLVYCTGLLKGNPVDFMEKAIKIDGVVGVKYTMTNYYDMHRITELNGGDINVINGPDEMLICGLTMGADGGIGSTYNLMTRRYCDLYAAFMAGEFQKAREIQFGINRIVAVLLRHGCIPAIKEALTLKGFDAGHVAYPGKRFDAEERRQLAEELRAAGCEI